jgi:hypothetical protein
MGNFIFDQQSNAEVMRSAAIDVQFTVRPSPDLPQWLDLAAECRGDLQGCVAKAEERGLERLAFDYRFAIVGTSDADHLTHPADAGPQAAIESRHGWADLASRFGSSS